MSLTNQELTIIIPAYNEERRISRTVHKYAKYFNKTGIDYEILVIVNGSKDKTNNVVSKLCKKYPTVLRYIEYKEKIGKGGAVYNGFLHANSNYIGFTDADNSVPPKQFHKLFKEIITSKKDAVIASRSMTDSIVVNKNITRKLISFLFSLTVELFFDLGIEDTQCGGKIFKNEPIKMILPKLFITDMAFDVNILTELKSSKYTISEIPITWVDDKNSKIGSPLKTGYNMFLSLLKIKLNQVFPPKNSQNLNSTIYKIPSIRNS